MNVGRPSMGGRHSVVPGYVGWISAAVCGLGVCASAGARMWTIRSDRVILGVRVWGLEVGGLGRRTVERKMEEKARRFLEQKVKLTCEKGVFTNSWFNLGVTVDITAAVKAAHRLGRTGGLWRDLATRRRAQKGVYALGPTFGVNSRTALRYFGELKERIDTKPVAGRLDLRRRTVVPGRVGYSLNVHRSVAAVLEAAWRGHTTVPLAVRVVRPALSGKVLQGLDISKVLGWEETPYHSRGKYLHRTHNLRVATRKLNGTVIMPGETISFNETLGPRTEREGYRVAPVIAGGEMVDGMAGGTCQISSTLFAAAYFAGLDVVEADVHSQPSHYIELGLDATVVWPDKDLRIRNVYDFPVVIHGDVNFGRVRIEILGARKPYRIGFERRILRQRPYKEVVRPDPEMEKGTRKVEQRGEFGYAVRRRRIFFDKNGNEIKSQYRTVIYPPTTMIVRLGTKPPADPLKPIPELPPLRPKAVPKRFLRIIR